VNTLLDEPVVAAVVKSACAACGGTARARGDVLCAACWPKARRELVRAYRAAWSAVQFEGQPEGRLIAAGANLVAGVRGEPLPYAEPPPPESIAPPRTPPPPARSILPSADDPPAHMTTTRKVRSTCRICDMEFEYPFKGGRRRTTCDPCSAPSSKAAPPAKREKRAPREQNHKAKAAHTTVSRTGAREQNPAAVASFDSAAIREQIRAELEAIGQRAAALTRVLEALDACEVGE
jgi:hypothetical protein